VSQLNRDSLQNSGLNPFLCAYVGNESDGSPLTVLSMLARRDQDPWDEAARWAKLPTSAAVESIAAMIGGARLLTQTASDARAGR
jgi:hypothetical protein